jgi:hypothetical protein
MSDLMLKAPQPFFLRGAGRPLVMPDHDCA